MGNASEAARIAGYKDAGQEGWRLLQNVGIQEAVEKRLARSLKRLGTDDLIKRLESHVMASVADYIEIKDKCDACGRYAPSFDLESFREDGLGHLLQEMTFNAKTGETRVKIHSVQRAVDILLKVAGAYSQRETDETSLASILAQVLRGEDEEPRTH